MAESLPSSSNETSLNTISNSSNSNIDEVVNCYKLLEIIRQSLPFLRDLFKTLFLECSGGADWSDELGPSLLSFCGSLHPNPGVNELIEKGNIEEWDITTLSFVILRLARLTDQERVQKGMTELRNLRNFLSHHKNNGLVTEEQYIAHVEQLRDYLDALGMNNEDIDMIIVAAGTLTFETLPRSKEDLLNDFPAMFGYEQSDGAKGSLCFRTPGNGSIKIRDNALQINGQSFTTDSPQLFPELVNMYGNLLDEIVGLLKDDKEGNDSEGCETSTGSSTNTLSTTAPSQYLNGFVNGLTNARGDIDTAAEAIANGINTLVGFLSSLDKK